MRIALITLGCPKNLVDAEVMLGLLDEAGHTLVDDPRGADLAVINTCSFISSAVEESRLIVGECVALKRDGLLGGVSELRRLGRVPYPSTHAWHLYIVRLDTEAVDLGRDDFMLALQEENIGTGLHFPALHTSSYYAGKYGYKPEDLPNAARAGETVISLPLYPLLDEADQDDVVLALLRVIARHGRRR